MTKIHPTVKDHGGYSNTKYGLTVNGAYEVRFGDGFIVCFHRLKADVIGLPECIPFVIVIESKEDSVPSIFASVGASKGRIGGTVMIDNENCAISITHGYRGLRFDGSADDFNEHNLLVEVNDEDPVYHDLANGRLFWVDLASPLKTSAKPTIVAQYDINLFSTEVVNQYLIGKSKRHFSRNLKTWLRLAIKAKNLGQLEEVEGRKSPNSRGRKSGLYNFGGDEK